MGGRRFSKPQGIRKKRKNANKQTLAKVAERKEEKEVKLERKLADAEARMRTARLRMLGGVPKTQEEQLAIEPSSAFQYKDDEEDEEGSEIINSKLDVRQTVYEKLSRSLENPIFGATGTGEETKSAKKVEKPVAKRPRRSERNLRSNSAKNGAQTRASEKSDPVHSAASIDEENHSAAIREKAHFDSALKPPSLEGKMQSICALPEVGKVYGLMAEDKRKILEASLTKELAQFDASRIGMPASVDVKWRKTMDDTVAAKQGRDPLFRPVHNAFIAVLREYHDLFLARRLSIPEEDMIRRLYVAHSLCHVLRSRGRVSRNDATKKANKDVVEGAKDQGFSRAKVLILLPFRNVAYDVVQTLKQLAVGTDESEKNTFHVANNERFETEFAPDSQEDLMKDDETLTSDSAGQHAHIRTSTRQSKEHQHVFRGNIDDDFKLGIAFSRKNMQLYTDFYASDIIIASPLGLRRSIIEKASGQSRHSQKRREEENEDTEWKTGLGTQADKRRHDDADEDFLSSIEICVIDGLHVFSMQNWDTLLETVSMVNKMPASTRDTDFSRVRDWCLDGLMERFRQTVMLSSYRKSDFTAMFRQLSNHTGKVQIVETPGVYGSMSDVAVKMRQTFFRIPDVTAPEEVPEKRLNFFLEEIFPQIRALLDSQTLLIVPNYFDFVRVRNKLLKLGEDDTSFQFASMCEYSKGSDISRVRSKLFDKRVSLIVLTERFHFFWRHWLRGANTIVWYGLPENCHYYPEVLNMTTEAAEVGRPVQSMALYDSFDVFALERIVGRVRCRKMVANDSRSTFLFA